ncbi:MAG: AAA family ATPase [Saprospiraceae bacterium]|nr:AAA family ATPase [Saprospiraceae bacterium]
MEDIRNTLKELSLKDGIDLVLNVTKDNDVFLLKSRLSNLESDNRRGLLILDEYNTQRNRLQRDWLQMLDTLSIEVVQQVTANSFLHIQPEHVVPKLRVASALLRIWKSDFGSLPDSHIDRPETTELLSWIDAPLSSDQKGIMLLIGNPGSGKSVVMGDVLRKLEERNIPVLGLKADQDCAENLSKLSMRLDLDQGIVPTIQALAQSEERVVLLVDQIDALSQSLSVRREYLNTFTRLIHALEEISNVRIIVSCRIYDLQNDQAFNFYQNQKQITLGKLGEEQVKSVLQKLDPANPPLSKELMGLLQVPLHLNVFCRIYRADLAFAKFKALRDLYEELWAQKIMTPTISDINPQKCGDLVAEIARLMYDRQSLMLAPALFSQNYAQELIQLQHAGIITRSSHNELVFFHQTFYEFAFAKQFVARSVPVEEYLEENKQNLHIRACLKMILEFLRESDPKEYLRVNHTILTSPNFYFHIKSLALSVIGFGKTPSSKEMELVRDNIFPDLALFKAFVSSVRSREWLLFLLEEKQLQKLIEPQPEPSLSTLKGVEVERYGSRVEMLNGVFQRHLPESEAEILTFLEGLPEFTYKVWLIERILYGIDKWDHPSSFRLFDAYEDKIDDFTSFELIKKAADRNLDWALGHLGKRIEKAVQAKREAWREIEFDHDITELLKQFVGKYPDQTFDLLLGFQLQQLTPLELIRTNHYSSIVNDYGFLDIDIEEEPEPVPVSLLYMLVYCARRLARSKSPRFEQFIRQTIGSNSATELLILVEGLRSNSSDFAIDIFEYIDVFLLKNGFNCSDSLSWRSRELLKEAYPYFSGIQKGQIIQLVSEIESKSEQDRALKHESHEWIGHERWLWLQCLPDEDLAQTPLIEKMAKELKAKFLDSKNERPRRFAFFRAVGAPLPAQVYKKMTLVEWKASFLKYNQDHHGEIGSDEGSMDEHADQFKKEVQERPDFFFPLIEELTAEHSFPTTYLGHGLDGLIAAKYPAIEMLDLFKKINCKDWSASEILQLISLCRYFIRAKIEDDYFLLFLIELVRTHNDPEDSTLRVNVRGDEVESIIVSSFNTVRGSVVHLLPYGYYFKQHETLLFETLEQIAEEDILLVRCEMIPGLSCLMHLDAERTLRLFLRLVQDGEEAMMKHSLFPARPLAWHNFEGMERYFEEALKHPNLHHGTGILLSLIWAFDRADSLAWLNRFVAISDEAIAGAIEVAAHNIRDENDQPISRSIEIFGRFLSGFTERIGQAYHVAFKHLKPADFSHLQPTLMQYKDSEIAQKKPGAFYQYLVTCAQEYPAECLNLVENFDQYERPDIRYSGNYSNEPLQVVLNAYNALWGKKVKRTEDKALLKKAMLLFDRMLLDERFYTHADKALELIEH